MRKQGRICKRCHRIRAVNDVGYCLNCDELLRKGEKRRPVRAETEPAVSETASTEPPPPEVE